jgi:hypothetical protein
MHELATLDQAPFCNHETVRLLPKKRHSSGIITSSLWISHGGGVEARSNPVIVSRTTFEYRKFVSGPSCRSSDCRRYLHPRSEGVPTQDVTLSVSNQSVVSSDLCRKSMTLEGARYRSDPQNSRWVTTQPQALSRQMREQISQVDFEGTSGGHS